MFPPWLTSTRDRLFPGGVGSLTLAFAHRDYRLYAGGNAVSLAGDWMQRLAVGWLTWSLTHSGAWLGAIAMAQFFPVVVLSPFAGVVADRHDRVKIIRVVQVAGGAAALLLAALVQTAAISIWPLFGLTLLGGIFNVVGQPARLALIPTLVERRALASALAINAISFNTARAVGPAVAGIVIVKFGIGLAFFLNAVSYAVFFTTLLALREPRPAPGMARSTRSVLQATTEAYRYARGHAGIAPILLLFAVSFLAVRGFGELFPGFAGRIFARGPEGLAMLTTTVGFGAIGGGLWLMLRPAITGVTRLVIANTLLMSLAVFGFALTRSFWLALICVFVAGIGLSVTETGVQTLLQAAAPDRLRGRLMALYGMIFRGGLGVSAFLLGALSHWLGLRVPLLFGAVVACAAWAVTRLKERRIAAGFEGDPAPLPAGDPP